jgi:DNA-binding response OmpR family regulator
MTKPFGIRELAARVRAILRRVEVDRENSRADTKETLRFEGLVIDPLKRRVEVRGQAVELTVKEFDLLHLFASHPGRAFNRQELLDRVWGYHYSGYSHTVNSHINRLRTKIEVDPSQPEYIQTVWGVGYRFVEHRRIPE